MAEVRTQARFPQVARGKGHYESFYLRAFDPARPRGVWIRYTIHKRPGAEPRGSVWFTFFDASASGPIASKNTLDEVGSGPDHYIHVGDRQLVPGRAVGSADNPGARASWDLRFDSSEPPWTHLPRPWMYRAPVPRTKLLSPYPDAHFNGWVDVNGQKIEVSGWPGMVGHNWGAEHAERWIWMHGTSFAGREGRAWLDAALGRIKLGPFTTPWIGNAVLALDGERHRLGGPGKARATEVRETPTSCEFVLPGDDIAVEGSVGADRKDFVGWLYADPDSGEHNTVNCSIAHMRLTVRREGAEPVELETAHGAAYELGMRERDHGIPVQPYPDGEPASAAAA
jgi:hypothetical protein